jgi:hypothetical protein
LPDPSLATFDRKPFRRDKAPNAAVTYAHSLLIFNKEIVMTVGRRDIFTRASVVALAMMLALGVVALAGCGPLDPDNGASISKLTTGYAPPAVKDQVINSLSALGYTASNVGDTYVTYPDANDTTTVLVDGTFFGPSNEKGVLASYSAIVIKRGADGTWTIVQKTAGTAVRPKGGEESKSGEASGSGEASATGK